MIKSSPSKRYVICDVCGSKYHLDQMKLIHDKYNLLYGCMVCPKDLEKTNPQNTPFRARKEHVVNPRLVRSEAEDLNYVFITDPQDIDSGTSDVVINTILASAPVYLKPTLVSSASVRFEWMSPPSIGSGRLLGWAIKRESPLGGGFSVLTSNTNDVDLSYIDTSVNASTQYNYEVACVTTAGIGAYSSGLVVTT